MTDTITNTAVLSGEAASPGAVSSDANDGFPDVAPPKEQSSVNKVSSNTKQHIIICFDESGSMGGPKIDESNLAKSDLISVLADPDNKNGFLVSAIGFASTPTRIAFGEPATTLQLRPGSAGGGTDFEAALNECRDVNAEFQARPNHDGWLYLRTVVLYMSDGHSSASDATIAALQEEADVIAIAFGSDANHNTLGKIASDGQVHVIGTKGGELRKFLAQVGETLSQSMQTARI